MSMLSASLRPIETACFSYWEESFLQIPISDDDVHFQDSSAFPVGEKKKKKKMIKDPKKIASCCLGQKRLLGI